MRRVHTGALRLVAVGVVGLVAVLGLSISRPEPAAAATLPASLPAAALPAAPQEPAISLPNPFDWLFQNTIGNPFRTGAQATLRSALEASEASLVTPALGNDPRVVQIWTLLVEIGDALLLLLIVIGAAMVVAGDWTYLEAKALAPRVIVCGVAMNLSQFVVGQAITWSNDLVKGFLSFGNSSLPSAFKGTLSSIQAPILLALLVIVVLLLLVANVARLVIVLVLFVAGPLLNAFGVLPATDGIARAWWRALAACLIAPCAQALLMVLAVWVGSSGASPFQSVFNNPAWAAVVNGSLMLVIIALMAISPLWMLKRALGEGHNHVSAAFKWGRRAVVGALS